MSSIRQTIGKVLGSNSPYFNNSSSGTVTKEDFKIISSIIAEFKDQSRKDIKKWRDALTAANNVENPRRYLLHDLYDYLSTDGHLESQLLLRRMATMSKKFMIVDSKTGKEDHEKTKLLYKRWFYRFMQNVIDANFFGYHLIEFAPGEKISSALVPPRNVIPEKRFVSFEVNGDKGVFYDPAIDFVIEAGLQRDFGVVNKIVPQLIWKKNAQQSWAEFSEKFGMPMITATTNKPDKNEIDKIETMLKKLGEAAQAVLPEGTTIDIKETATKSDPFNVYDKQIERTNSEISKAILATTMMTDDGSSKSQSEVHERTVDNKVAAADQTNLLFTINEDLLPLLIKLGEPFSENDEFKWDDSEKLSMDEYWKIVDGISDKFIVPEQWISETFNVPIEGVIEKEASGGANANFNNGRTVFSNISGQNFPEYKSIACCAKHNYVALANDKDWERWTKKMNAQSESIMRKLWDGENTDFDLLEKTILNGTIYQDGLLDGWSKRTKIAYDAVDHVVLQSMEYNLFHFSNARGTSELTELNRLLIDKDTLKIRTYSDFKELAKPLLTNINDKWLKTEYNHTWAVSQNASSFHSFWKDRNTTSKIIYRSIQDDNVRVSHELLNGKIFNINDPEARRLWPPNGFGCRCEFEQYLGSGQATKGEDAIKLIPDADKDFLVNRGETRQVFSANQFYAKSTVKGFNSTLSSLNHKSFKQGDLSTISSKKPSLKLDKTITKDNVSDFFKKDKPGDYMPFKDHLNRRMILSEKTFKDVSGSTKSAQLFPNVKDTVLNSDEMYILDDKSTRYIKFYKDELISVDVEAGESMNIINWESSKNDKSRQGLLIHKK